MSILNNRKSNLNNSYLAVSILGKSLKLNINYINGFDIKLIEKNCELHLYLPKKYKNKDNIDIINLAIRNLYDKVAEIEVENAMELARHIVNFAPEDYLIKRINDGFYKSNKNLIIINPDIVQYSRETINTTVIQAFCKAKYRSNSNSYKELLQMSMKKYENYFNDDVKVS